MIDFNNGMVLGWGNAGHAGGIRFQCAYCGTHAGASGRYDAQLLLKGRPTGNSAYIAICNVCSEPTYFDVEKRQIPAPRLGAKLEKVPPDGLRELYDEARDCSSVRAYTACVMACRKILMNLAVREGAGEGLSFVDYVNYLDTNGFTPKKGKEWVDRIRKMGNEATHEIAAKSKDDAESIVHLVEMLLRFNFELGNP